MLNTLRRSKARQYIQEVANVSIAFAASRTRFSTASGEITTGFVSLAEFESNPSLMLVVNRIRRETQEI